MKEINLILNNQKRVTVNSHLLDQKIKELHRLLNIQKELKEKSLVNSSRIDNQINKVALLLQGLGYKIAPHEVQNIIKKNNPSDQTENLISNLHDALNFFNGQRKYIHQNNITILFQILVNDKTNPLHTNVFRTTNDLQTLSYFSRDFKVVDFNSVPVIFDQFIQFINLPDSEFSPFLNMQIVHLHSLAMAPFVKYNALLSKIISLWYLNLHKHQNQPDLPPELYLEAIHLNQEAFQKAASESIATGDYTNFILFVIEKLSQSLEYHHLVEKIVIYLRQKKRLFLAPHETKFLFFVLYYRLHQFDWKKFKKISQLSGSKQYIMLNLGKLEKKYDLLSAETLKNRKFFSPSRFLRSLIGMFGQPQNNKIGVHH